jgi:hypothetical protein
LVSGKQAGIGFGVQFEVFFSVSIFLPFYEKKTPKNQHGNFWENFELNFLGFKLKINCQNSTLGFNR